MSTPATDPWIIAWLESVASGALTMSQRAVTSVDKHGGLAVLQAAAEARGVHLLLLEDDQGAALVAASRRPFRMLC